MTLHNIAATVLFLSLSQLACASATAVDIQCSRIGDDPFAQQEQLIISGNQGAYSYKAYDEQREYLSDLQCSNTGVGSVCQRIHKRDDGLSVSHYFLHTRKGLSKLTTTNFSQNSELSGQLHYASAQEFLVKCVSQ